MDDCAKLLKALRVNWGEEKGDVGVPPTVGVPPGVVRMATGVDDEERLRWSINCPLVTTAHRNQRR